MSITSNYSVVRGDTFDSISRKIYGEESGASVIASANPGVVEPLSAGTLLIIPRSLTAPENRKYNAAFVGVNETAILINSVRFRFWESVQITRALDTFDTVSFSAPFAAEEATFRDTFRPFSYRPLEVTVGGAPLFTGTVISVAPDVSNVRKSIQVNGYSLPGVLSDCTPPASAFPLEFNGNTLREIASTLLEPFGIRAEFSNDPGPVFDRVAIEPGKKILTFLIALAKQRNLIITNSVEGALVFHRPVTDAPPVAILRQGERPLKSVTATFSPQDYFSHITAIEPVYASLGGGQFTERNSRLAGVLRPHTFKADDTATVDAADAVRAKMGRMFGAAAKYTLQVATWRAPGGSLWAPGDTILLDAPDAMVYGSHKFIIHGVTLSRDADGETATLSAVLPGSFGGVIPEVLPWEN